MSFILTFANFLFPLITFSYVSRVLTPNGTGKIAFVNSVISYFLYIACLGIPAYGRRESAKQKFWTLTIFGQKRGGTAYP